MKFEKKFTRRAFLGAVAAGGFAASTCRFLQQAGVIPSSESENIENWRTTFTKEAQRSQTIEGAIVDRNGEPLTEAGGPGTPASVLDVSYGALVGVRTSGGELTGLRKTYEDLLYSTLPGKGAGRTLHLSIDSELQKFAYSLISGTRGTCMVMNARTGSMLACATSRGTLEFDVNHYAELYDIYKNEPNFFADPLITPMAPGSVMKLVTASAMLKNGVDMVYYDDTPSYKGIKNYSGKSWGKLNLNNAVVHSSNTYFAHGVESVGTSNFLKEAGCWGFADAVPAPTVVSSWQGVPLKTTLGLKADSDPAELRMAGFGEGSVLTCPLQVLLWYGALALNNDEAVGAPHVVEYIEDPNGVEETKYIETSPALPTMFAGYSKTQETLRAAFAGAAEAYKLKSDKVKEIYAKTGTATQPDGKNTVMLAFSFITQKDESYVAIISRSDTDKTSAVLKEPARELLKHTLEVVG